MTRDHDPTERYPCGKQQQLAVSLHSHHLVKPQISCSHSLGNGSRKLHRDKTLYDMLSFFELKSLSLPKMYSSAEV